MTSVASLALQKSLAWVSQGVTSWVMLRQHPLWRQLPPPVQQVLEQRGLSVSGLVVWRHMWDNDQSLEDFVDEVTKFVMSS